MKRFLYICAVVGLLGGVALLQDRALGQSAKAQSAKVQPAKATTAKAGPAAGAEQAHAMLNTYCFGCHNSRVKSGGLALDVQDLKVAAENGVVWEKALRKLRGHLMPPPGAPQPPQQTVDTFVTWSV
jgi:mono/diheme cytochrome c family protein